MAKSKISNTLEANCDEQHKKYRYQSKAAKQKLFIQKFVKNNAMVQTTCDEVGITRKTYYEWLKEEKFKLAIDDAIERKLDKLENKVNDLIDKGDTTMTIFAAKCLLKNRGYKEKQEIEVNGNLNVKLFNIDPISNE